VDADIAALRPSKPFEALPKSRETRLHFWIVLGKAPQYADAPHLLGLLRARRDRPRHRRAAEQRDELATPHALPSVRVHILAHRYRRAALCITAKSPGQ
jgi:hypothetical protein